MFTFHKARLVLHAVHFQQGLLLGVLQREGVRGGSCGVKAKGVEVWGAGVGIPLCGPDWVKVAS